MFDVFWLKMLCQLLLSLSNDWTELTANAKVDILFGWSSYTCTRLNVCMFVCVLLCASVCVRFVHVWCFSSGLRMCPIHNRCTQKKKIKATAHICGVITHCCASVLPIFEQFSYHFFGLLLLQKVEERASKINKIGTQIDWRMWSSSMYIIKCIDSYICYNCRFSRMLSISIDRLTTTTTTKYNDIVSLFRHSQKSISMP